jgi:hypothetical protein
MCIALVRGFLILYVTQSLTHNAKDLPNAVIVDGVLFFMK